MSQTDAFKDLLSGNTSKVIACMKQNGIAFFSMVAKDDNEKPIGGVYFVIGEEESQAIEKSFRAIENKFS